MLQDQIAVVSRARRGYGRRTALAGVDVAFRAGEIFALVGPNGAGKSTLVRALAGVAPLDGGSVRIAGADPRSSAAARLLVGLVPQDIALYPHLTVRENLEVFGRLAALPRRRLRAALVHAMERTRTTPQRDLRVDTLSGGYQRRVNIAAAILHAPRLLILDEPTVGVDAEAREALNEVLRGLRADGAAILLVTHDFDQAAVLADRVGVMIAGRMVLEGAPAELIADSFGTGEEVAVTLVRAPPPAVALALESVGFGPTPDPVLWRGVFIQAGEVVRHLHMLLHQLDTPLREIRVRPPGIGTLVARLVARTGAAP